MDIGLVPNRPALPPKGATRGDDTAGIHRHDPYQFLLSGHAGVVGQSPDMIEIVGAD